jgi:RimJ/RimL family protein N-acetyltransferase
MELDAKLCRLRPWRLDDLPSLVRHANDWEVAKNLRDVFPHPYTEDAGRGFLERCMRETADLMFAIEANGEAVGGIGLHPGGDVARASAELGYWLGRAHWGQGLATAALTALVEYAFAELPYCRLHAHAFADNRSSQRVLEKAGFAKEGVLPLAVLKAGRLHDMVLYGKVDRAAAKRILASERRNRDGEVSR